MTRQRITVTHFKGEPLEHQAIYFETLAGDRYRLTHFEVVDGQPLWLHGYREEPNGVRFYSSRTPDELTPTSLVCLR